ncbi:D-lactonohydrolase-like protein [Rickenella mellea]|uniref:D-lactonohydrolase-like protein n=1 Tax=Rickenella mellea TaxID=50990 RepID=A0A4Y7PJV5_9AGAM|nr:D-lactonohydrolase-like protein [Rickenella mellea]
MFSLSKVLRGAVLVAIFAVGGTFVTGAGSNASIKVPPNSVFVDPLSFAVLGSAGNFRTDGDLFNPTNTTPPFFQIFDSGFLDILGASPSVRLIASNATFAFAHEAPIWIPSTDTFFFASNDGGALGNSDINNNNQVSMINLKNVGSSGKVSFAKVSLADTIQMTNGGTNFRGNLLLINSGRGTLPPNLALVKPSPPFNSTIILDNFFGRQFNSLNDVKIHPKSKAIFFTDVTYGWLNHFRPLPQLPNQVYRFNPDTGELRVVADGFNRCNGIAFSADGNTAFITDTGLAGGFFGLNSTDPATIYAFDVDAKSQAFKNRRVFAYVDNGVPDGIQLDTKGNVYSGCGDGVQVWNSQGTLLGKIFLGTTSANMAFAGKGRLVILAETAVYLANIAATGVNLDF